MGNCIYSIDWVLVRVGLKVGWFDTWASTRIAAYSCCSTYSFIIRAGGRVKKARFQIPSHPTL